MGIFEIGQRGETIALYCEDIDASLVLDLSSVLRGRVSVTQKGKKSINVKKLDNQNSLDTLKEIFEAIESINKSKQGD